MMRSPLRLAISLTLVAAGAVACSGAPPEEESGSSESALAKRPPIGRLPPIIIGPTLPPDPQPPPPPPITIGDANDPATILADEKVFWDTYFGGTDDGEVAYLKSQFAADGSGTPPYWGTGQRIVALVQMYDLLLPIDATVAAKYLSRLRAIAHALFQMRDDNRVLAHPFITPTVNAHPVDPFRNRVMPAWGALADDRDGKWNTDVSTAGLFSYAMAAFARRVAENPALHTEHGYEAVFLTAAVLDTYEAFRPEMHLVDSDAEASYRLPTSYAGLQCNSGGGCENYRSAAGQALAWNEGLSMSKALADIALAADSALFRSSTAATSLRLDRATREAPLLIAKSFTFFDHHLRSKTASDGRPYFEWDHQLPSPARIQDIAHGGFEVGALAVLLEDKIALNALLARSGRSEQVGLSSPLFVRFANTFLVKVWHYDYGNANGLRNVLDRKVDGTSNPSETVNSNVECAGWIPLAQFDPWIWTRCHDATFHVGGGIQRYLRVDNHAALLRYRQYH